MKITELEVWKSAMDLSQSVFELTQKFPEMDSQGLGYQVRRTVTNLPSNVAAAASRKYGKESLKYLFKAKGYIYEVETLLYLAERLGYISEEELTKIIETLDTARRLLFGFIKYYKRTSPSNSSSL
jgi:four helix bundle protein